jgi:hypothetical protein
MKFTMDLGLIYPFALNGIPMLFVEVTKISSLSIILIIGVNPMGI